MRARHHHEHDLLVGLQHPDPVHDQRIADLPARLRLRDDVCNRLLRHPGIMLERHVRNLLAALEAAHHADEARDGAGTPVALAQCIDFTPGVEVLCLDAHRHRRFPCSGLSRR